MTRSTIEWCGIVPSDKCICLGALWIRAPDELQPMLFGGGQESGLRPGTENVADAVGLAAAATLVTRDLDSLGIGE